MIILRYLNREILLTTLAISFCLFLLFFGNRFAQYLNQAAVGELTAGAILQILAYRIPDIMMLILPISYFLGILIAYGRLYSDNEMVVMSSGGISQFRLLLNALVSAVFVAAIVGFLSLFVSPYTIDQVEKIKAQQANRSFFELLIPGRFERISDDDPIVYNFENFSRGGSAIDKVFIADVSPDEQGREQVSLLTADTAFEVTDSPTGHRYLVFNKGRQYIGRPGELDFQVTEFTSSGQILEKSEQDAELRNYFERLPTKELLKSNHVKIQAELQWRLSIPLWVFVLTFIAVPLSYTNPRKGRYAKIFPAFVPAIIYMGLLKVSMSYVSDGKLSPTIGLWWVHGLFLSFGIALLLWNGGRPLGKWRSSQISRLKDQNDSGEPLCVD